jgi:hypothetical protein
MDRTQASAFKGQRSMVMVPVGLGRSDGRMSCRTWARTAFITGLGRRGKIPYQGDSSSRNNHFVGVGFYDTGEALRREGAACVFTDFSDRAAFLAKLNEIWND